MTQRKYNRVTKAYIRDLRIANANKVAEIEAFAYNALRAKSPVDTGAYRANHNRSASGPDHSFDPSKTSGEQPAPSIVVGRPMAFLAHGAPYAEPIEHWHSQQAPAGVYGVVHDMAKARFKL